MSKENMIDRMTLFIRKGAGLRVRSRKEQSHEEISFGIGAYQTRSSVASSSAHSPDSSIDCVCEFQAGRFRKQKALGCGRARCLLCHFDKIFGVPKVADRVHKHRFVDSLEDYRAGE